MTKKMYVLIAVVALVALVRVSYYLYYNTDLISHSRIQILKSNRPSFRTRFSPGVYPVMFMLDGEYKLTAVKVVPAAALATNKHPVALWRLVTKSNSPPLKGFYYGQPIPGMVPFQTNARPKGLQPNVTYRLFVEAGRARGELDFQAQAVSE